MPKRFIMHDLVSGIYTCRLENGHEFATNKLYLMEEYLEYLDMREATGTGRTGDQQHCKEIADDDTPTGLRATGTSEETGPVYQNWPRLLDYCTRAAWRNRLARGGGTSRSGDSAD